MITVPIAGLPVGCPHCGKRVAAWPVRPYMGQVVLSCPHCHTRLGPLLAVAAPEGAAVERWGDLPGAPSEGEVPP